MGPQPEETLASRIRVDGYGDEGFTVSGVRREGPVILRLDEAVAWRLADDFRLDESAAEPLLQGMEAPGIVLIGTGRLQFVAEPAFVNHFRTHGFEPDLMTTGAACRTWNVLAMEGRNVVAGLLPAGWLAERDL